MASGDMLTDEELALLNNLAYIGESDIMPEGYDAVWDGTYENKGLTLGGVLDEVVKNSGGLDTLRAQGDSIDSSHISGTEWANMIEEAMTNENIANLQYADVDSYSTDGSLAFTLTSDTYTYVVFKGTGADASGSEWPDNILGLYQSDTAAQRAALDYLQYTSARHGGEIVVSGHSKGANKAMYATVVSGLVSRCVAFDGQGFGSSFHSQHSNEIASSKSLIWAYNVEGDFVSPLLSTIAGTVTYLKGNRLDGDFAKNHSPSALLNDSLGFDEGTQSAFSKELNKFSMFILDSVPDAQLEKIANFLAPLVDEIMMSPGDIDKDQMMRIIASDPEGFATLIACLSEYPGYSELIRSFANDGFVSIASKKAIDDLLSFLGPIGKDIMQMSSFLSSLGMPGFDNAWAESFFSAYQEGKRVISPGSGSLSSALATAGTATVREFTEAKKAELIAIVKEVENESWLDPSRWDVWYRVESWAGRLSIDNYQYNMSEYFRKNIDINATSETDINDIFDRAIKRDATFSATIEGTNGSLQFVSQKCNGILAG